MLNYQIELSSEQKQTINNEKTQRTLNFVNRFGAADAVMRVV